MTPAFLAVSEVLVPMTYANQADQRISGDGSTNTHTIYRNTNLTQAVKIEPPRAFTIANFRLFCICTVGFLCEALNGFDSSLLNGLLQNTDFKSYFHGSNIGIWVGLISFLYQIGSIAAIPFVGPALDTWGRRKGIFTGVCIVIIGVTIQGITAYTHSLRQFMIGRFFLGFGAQIAACGGAIYVMEVCHPAYRDTITGLYNTCWYGAQRHPRDALAKNMCRLVGAIIASGAVRGSLNLAGNGTWLLPVWLQLLCATTVAIFILFLPESPRWLFVNGKMESAIAVVTKYHGGGSSESVWVALQEQEFRTFLKQNGSVSA